MTPRVVLDEALVARLPLPLAQLLRRAHNAKSVRDRHDTAYCLWEASLKLLGSVAVVTYAEQHLHDPKQTERLQNLARPSLGHWWEFVRELTPLLVETGGVPDEGFTAVRSLLLGGVRHDLPHCAGLDGVLRETLDGKPGTQATVQVRDLFDRLVRYRNREVGHGALGQKAAGFYERVGQALLAAVPELLGKLDVLAGRRLLYVAEVKRRGDGSWLAERGDLTRENYQRLVSLEFAADQAESLPRPERLYLWRQASDLAEDLAGAECCRYLHALHPLVCFEPDTNEVLFLNARRKKRRAEYLCYNTGRVIERNDLANEQRALLQRVLEVPIDEAEAEAWAARSQADDLEAGPADAGPEVVRRLGDYELYSKLGQGGMGAVYRANQSSLGRQVALKVLLRSGDPKAEARFRREIHALGQVEHPHLVKIFTSGSDGEQWFYAMELVEGTTLAGVLERLQTHGRGVGQLDQPTWQALLTTACDEARAAETPLSSAAGTASGDTALCQALAATNQQGPDTQPGPRAPDQPEGRTGWSYVHHVVELVRQTAEAVHALHEKGIIHRDIKPGNIMVGPTSESAVLMDLGLAQVSDEIDGKLTKTRQFVGTLRYASPEQVMAVARLDRRSDVYSLGATLWELLAVRPLFDASDATPTPRLMMQIQQDDPGRLHRYQPAVPRDLEAIVSKCLEKKPEQRYATAQELARDLGDFLAGKPVQARPVGSLGRAWRWVKRRPGAAATLAGFVLLAVVSVSLVVWQWRAAVAALGRADQANRRRLLAQVNALPGAAAGAVPAILADLEANRAEVLPYLRQLYEDETELDKRRRLALALLPVEPDRLRQPLTEAMLRTADPAEMLLVREALRPHASELAEFLWQTADTAKDAGVRFRALVALATFDPDSTRWHQIRARRAVEQLLSANSLHLGQWLNALRPVAPALLAPLGEAFRNDRLPELRLPAAIVLADYAKDDVEVLARLVLDAESEQYAVLRPVLERNRANVAQRMRRVLAQSSPPSKDGPKVERWSRDRAMAAVTLLHLGQTEPVWPLFRRSADPEARSHLVWRAGLLKVDPGLLIKRLDKETDVSAKRALIVALGEYRAEQLPADVREPVTKKLLAWYQDDPDPGIHGAIDWLLRHANEGQTPRPLDWGQARELRRIDDELKRRDPDGQRRWYVNKQGQTMVLIPGPVEFHMGSPETEPERFPDEVPHQRRIARTFAIAAKAVTVEEFQRYLTDRGLGKSIHRERYSPEEGGPINNVSWYMAAQYCNWLSEKEGIPKDHWCYPEDPKDIKVGMKLKEGHLKLKGYRLPTEAEWEYACRAETESSNYYGTSAELLPRYAWYINNSYDRTWPVGQKRPNDFGLFDMHGNVWHWCQDRYMEYPVDKDGKPVGDDEDGEVVKNNQTYSMRGGSFNNHPMSVRAATRYKFEPQFGRLPFGFRLARTWQ
jgi:formylglycine-generating enzyme required for sulfatase activity/serine/threonine protein kinase